MVTLKCSIFASVALYHSLCVSITSTALGVIACRFPDLINLIAITASTTMTTNPMLWLFLAFVLLPRSVASDTIQLEYINGTYTVPVRINGQIAIPFVLDTGAAEVSIPQDVFLTLLRTKTVNDKDFIGPGIYIMADGSKHASERFILREMSVGSHVVKNVIANIIPVKGEPLLGQTFLARLSGWAIDNDRHMLVLRDEPADPSSKRAGDFGIKYSVIFFGKCRYQLVQGFFPCDEKLIWNALKNGRMVLSFITDKMLFHLSGGGDRQPNLENYYVSIDTFTMQKIPGGEPARDERMEGECHFRLNKDASKFYDVKCDVYDRAKGLGGNFYLEGIRKFDRKVF